MVCLVFCAISPTRRRAWRAETLLAVGGPKCARMRVFFEKANTTHTRWTCKERDGIS